MPTTINASNTTGGAVVTGDGSGVLELQSGGVTGITVNGANVTVAGTLTAAGGVPVSELTGVLPVANGGTGLSSPGTAGNVLTSDGTGWVSSTSSAYTEFLNQSTDVTLTSVNVGQVVIDPTVSIMVQLPNATTLQQGDTFAITNMSQQDNIFVRSSDGTYQAFVAAGQTVNVTAEDISTAAGVWVADNPNYGFSSPVSLGFTGTYSNSDIGSGTAVINATKMIRINRSSTNQAGVTATIITKSGADLTKGPEQYLFNFNVSMSYAGYINVEMTSETTGIISTIGNNDGTTSNIFLYTFSIDANDVVEVTGATSIPTTLITNSRGVALQTLSATSVIITYSTSGPIYAARILTLSSGLITAIGAQSTINSGGFGYYQALVALSSSLVVTAYINAGSFYVIAGTISGSTITWGTGVLVVSAVPDYWQSISRLSATEFIVTHAGGANIKSNYGSVSGTTITLGAQNTYTGGGSAIFSLMSYPISSTSALVVFYDSSVSYRKPYAFVLTKSGTSLTRGSVYTLTTNLPSLNTPSVFSLKSFVAFDPIQQPATDLYMDVPDQRYVFALPLSVSGTVVTPGTGLLVTPENVSFAPAAAPAICTLSATRAIAFVNYFASSDGSPSSRLYLLDTSGARPVVIATSSDISTATVFCAGQLTPTRAIIAYAASQSTAATLQTLDIVGDVFTFNSSVNSPSLIGARPAIVKINSTKAMLYVANAANSHRIYRIYIADTTLSSGSFVSTQDTVQQPYASKRILYNFGDIGYFLQVNAGTQTIATFNMSGANPTDLTTSTASANSSYAISYSTVIAPGTFSALAPDSTGYGSFIYSGVDGNLRTYTSITSPEIAGAGILLPFNQNSIMVCGNSNNYYGKITVSPASVACSQNTMIFDGARNFAPAFSMHEPIQDWVDGDYFAPNTDKILFVGRNSVNLEMEMYHVFDKGAAQ